MDKKVKNLLRTVDGAEEAVTEVIERRLDRLRVMLQDAANGTRNLGTNADAREAVFASIGAETEKLEELLDGKLEKLVKRCRDLIY